MFENYLPVASNFAAVRDSQWPLSEDLENGHLCPSFISESGAFHFIYSGEYDDVA